MTESEALSALVRYRLEQADEALRSAETNLAAGLDRSAMNRAYYAMFYAVLALLATEKKETSRHSAAISLFDLHFVKDGPFPKEFSRWLHDSFDLRQDADYAPVLGVTAEQVREAAERARRFVIQTRSVLETRLGGPGPRGGKL